MRQMLRALPREFDTTAVTVRHAGSWTSDPDEDSSSTLLQ